jgi:hypothetical protein
MSPESCHGSESAVFQQIGVTYVLDTFHMAVLSISKRRQAHRTVVVVHWQSESLS